VERKREQLSKYEGILLVTFYRLTNTPGPLRPQTENYQSDAF